VRTIGLVVLAPVRILFPASEVDPYSKTGGLADVAGSLPLALARRGHEVRVVTPRYRVVDASKLEHTTRRFTLEFPFGPIEVTTFEARPHERLTQVFLEVPALFDRAGLYGERGDYPDNARRFTTLAVGALNPLLDRRPAAVIGPWVISGGWLSFASVVLRFVLTVGAALALVACARSLGVQTALVLLLAASAPIFVMAAVPLGVAGFGTRELASVAVLGAMGVPPDQAAGTGLLYGLCGVIMGLLAAPLFVFRGRPT
jgi:uncharacterized membrane protein YbhN (UPF0104 family)